MQHLAKLITTLYKRSNPPKVCSYLLILVLFVACHQQKANGENKTVADQPAQQTSVEAPTNANSITIVNWNIEWLGSTSNGPRDKVKQLQNAIKVLQYLKADLYCLCEIVDPKSLVSLTEAMGSNYTYALSPYGSGARSTRDPGYNNTQKLAFIYNTQRFKNIKTSAYLQNDARAGYYFASGRYPYTLTATVHTAEVSQLVDFMIIHGKSGADQNSYERRFNAATALKTALDKEKANDAVMLLGDFNDHMTGSITRGKPSPYRSFEADPAYHVLTLDVAGQRSTLDYNGVIDQQVISKSLNRYYRAGSVRIRTDITAVVPDFKTGNTSDHYPVSSEFIFDKARFNSPASPASKKATTDVMPDAQATTTADGANPPETGAVAPPQNLQQKIFTADVAKGSILIRSAVKCQHIQFILYNKRQHKVLSVSRKYILKGDDFRLKTPVLYKGDYTLVIFSDHGKQVITFSVS